MLSIAADILQRLQTDRRVLPLPAVSSHRILLWFFLIKLAGKGKYQSVTDRTHKSRKAGVAFPFGTSGHSDQARIGIGIIEIWGVLIERGFEW